MFGKPEWFRDKTFGWGLVPVSWQGWLYSGVWMSVITAPFLVLLTQQKPFNAGIWMTAAIIALIADVWQIKRLRKPPLAVKKETVLYIGEDDLDTVSTKSRELQLRR